MKRFKYFLLEQPSEAQIKAGNYKKKHMCFNGCDIAIENRKGSVRSGTDPNGKEWSIKMPFDYGYIKRTNGADGDAVDVFVGPDKKSERIFTINQTDDKGKFDEHKVMMGFTDKKDAEKGYLSAYDKGWSNYEKDIIEMDIDTFKKWLDVKSQKKPMTESFVLLLKENTEINTFASENNITLIKKSAKIWYLDVNGVKVKIQKRAKNTKVGGNVSGAKWGETQKVYKGVSFITDLFGDTVFDRRKLELALLNYSKDKNISTAISQKDYTLDNGTFGTYRPHS